MANQYEVLGKAPKAEDLKKLSNENRNVINAQHIGMGTSATEMEIKREAP